MPKRNRKAVLQTVLIVGEGARDEAFIKHLKSVYVGRESGISVRIINAQGGSPHDIVTFTIRQIQNASYDRVIVVMDTDVQWLQKTITRAKKKKIKLIGTEPCIEGLMLGVLDRHVPSASNECKRQLEQIITGDLTDKRSYVGHFPRNLIDEKCESNFTLNEIVKYLHKQN
jgi:hypothetical protein